MNDGGRSTGSASAARVGFFAIGALVLLVAAIAVLLGGGLLTPRAQVVMHFGGSVHGLEPGAAVVMRGVRVGTVRRIELQWQGERVAAPVLAELDLQRLAGGRADGLQALLAQGLTAQLASQSLLTGQLYVDLDLRPTAPRLAASTLPLPAGATLIPTTAQRFEGLQAQIEALDLSRITQDLSAVLAKTRTLAESPELRDTLAELARTTQKLARVADTLERRSGPLADRADSAFARAGDAAAQLGQAAERSGASASTAAARVAAAAARAEALLTPGSPVLASVQRAADELVRSASALAAATAASGPTAQRIDATLAEVQRAARAARDLATLLNEQPDAILRGRRGPPPVGGEETAP
jgi:paraquat-inducible protein B